MAAVDSGAEVKKDGVMVWIETKEGKRYRVQKRLLNMFGMIKNMTTALGELDDETTLPLSEVRGPTFNLMTQWAEHHVDDPLDSDPDDEEDKDRRIDDIPQWDQNFINQLSRSQVFEMLQACNYLDLPLLLEQLAKTVAGWMKGKTVEEVRAEFGIVNDYTPEEEERLKKENAWAEEAVVAHK